MNDPLLNACFLGPYAENDGLLEKLIVEFFRDHVYWRRNVHPEDPPAIPTSAAQTPEYQAFESRMRRELHSLSAALKRSVPFHSPRYLGHMVSDLLLPGLAAQILTLPYNPNNVSEEAAPITVDMELQVGLQLARMVGYDSDPEQLGCALGFVTTGGTTANFQALRLALALKAFPVALRAIAPPGLDVPQSDWAAFNMHPRKATELYAAWGVWLKSLPANQAQKWQSKLDEEKLQHLGIEAFFKRHTEIKTPIVIAPITAHYSWSKGVKLLGLGRQNLVGVREVGMRIDLDDLHRILQEARAKQQPVLMAVAIFGTTEFGTIDPLDGVINAREEFADDLGFVVHVDAAWGGYLASAFRRPDGSLRPRKEIAHDFIEFPRDEVYSAVEALAQSDSITIDPHKLGYIPYGAGAFICRDNRAIGLLCEKADYVFTAAGKDDYLQRYRQLGAYSFEGSRSGASVAAVYVTHKVLPLDYGHFGRLINASVQHAESFRAAINQFTGRHATSLRVHVPFEPDSNLVCFAINRAGNRDIAEMNRSMYSLYQHLRSDPSKPVQAREFFASMTRIGIKNLGKTALAEMLEQLDIDPASVDQDDPDRSGIVVLRHTLMNPYLNDSENNISYIDRYFQHLDELTQHVFLRSAS